MDVQVAIALTRTLRTESGLFFDFDGTLAPIRPDPETVEVPVGTVPSLSAIAARVKRIGIVSARPLAFLLPRFYSVPGIRMYGVYGLETLGPSGELVRHPNVQSWEPSILAVAEKAQAELPNSVRIENKGVSLVLHFREASHHQTLVEHWAHAHAREIGLRIRRGRMMLELVPPLDHDKGDIVEVEAKDLRCAWYFGDDISDIDAFSALERQEDSRPGFLGIKVAVCNSETGDDVRAMADFSLDSPEHLSGFLNQLSQQL